MLFLYLGVEVIRLFFGTKGNLCQRKMPLGISVALTFPSTMMASYYLLLQTYVLRLEAIMNGILLFFCGSELLLEVLTLTAFSRASCVDLAGSLGFQKDLSHALPMCAVPYMSCKSTRCLRRVCFQSDAKAAHAIPRKLSSRTF
ncbi:PREDICTED: transmembrane protein 216 isoform X1 [Bison bison bison]|uniref:Transmembrane protein 216 n=1 Tax=Bison bison bison TaxID=43346 RepID=A0A6P3GYF5_BISBB|nr:PREDICTED: transmembrane protein 216 isoform X1 [Bison bison bison]